MLKPLAAALRVFAAAAHGQAGSLDDDTTETISKNAHHSLATNSVTEAEHLYRSGSVLVTASHFIATGGLPTIRNT